MADNLAVDVREAEISALVAEHEPFVVDPQALQDGRIEIVNVNRVLQHVVAEIVGLTVNDTGLDSTTRHPLGVTPWMVVASVVALGQSTLAINCSAEFTTPNHQRVVEHPPLLEIIDQGRTRLIDDPALAANVAGQVSVLVPLPDKHLGETNTAFGQAAGQ